MRSHISPSRETGEGDLLERLRSKRTLPSAADRRQIREAAGASLRDVASALGTSATSVIRWERGASPPRHLIPAYARLLEQFKQLAALDPAPEMRTPGLTGHEKGVRGDEHGQDTWPPRP
jgi:DNA-binding transcriptional regulator YiaG